jgi:hypothetical protein
MARIQGVAPDRAGFLTRIFYRVAARMVGKVPEPMTISAHHPQIFQANGAYEFFLGRARRVPERLKTLAGIKAAMLIGCPF